MNQYIKLSKKFLLSIILLNLFFLSSIVAIERRDPQKELSESEDTKEEKDFEKEHINSQYELDLFPPENINNDLDSQRDNTDSPLNSQGELDFLLNKDLDSQIKDSLDIYFEGLSKTPVIRQSSHGKLFLYDMKKIFTEIKEMTNLSIYKQQLCNEKRESINFWVTDYANRGRTILCTLWCEQSNHLDPRYWIQSTFNCKKKAKYWIKASCAYKTDIKELKRSINRRGLLVQIPGEKKTSQDVINILDECITKGTSTFTFSYKKNGILLSLSIRGKPEREIALFHTEILEAQLNCSRKNSLQPLNNPNINGIFSETDYSSQLSHHINNKIKFFLINRKEWNAQSKESFLDKRQEWLLKQGVDLRIESQSDSMLKESFQAIDSIIKEQLYWSFAQGFNQKRFGKSFYYQNFLYDLKDIVEVIGKMSDLFIDGSLALCNAKAKSMHFPVQHPNDGKEYLSSFRMSLINNNNCPYEFTFESVHILNISQLKKNININPDFLITTGDPITERKTVMDILDGLIYYSFNHCSLCVKPNGIFLRILILDRTLDKVKHTIRKKIDSLNKMIDFEKFMNNLNTLNNQVGIFSSQAFQEVFTVPWSPMEIVNINNNDKLDFLLKKDLDSQIKYSLDVFCQKTFRELEFTKTFRGKFDLYDIKKICTEIKKMTNFSIYKKMLCNEKKESINFWKKIKKKKKSEIILHRLGCLQSKSIRSHYHMQAINVYKINGSELKNIIEKNPDLLVTTENKREKCQEMIKMLNKSIKNEDYTVTFSYKSEGIGLLSLISPHQWYEIGTFYPDIISLVFSLNQDKIIIINEEELNLQNKQLFLEKSHEWLLKQGVDLRIENQSDPILQVVFQTMDSLIKEQLNRDQQVFAIKKYEETLYYQNYRNDMQNIVKAIGKISDLFIDDCNVLCDVQGKSLNFPITHGDNGEKYLSYCLLSPQKNDLCKFNFTIKYKIDFEKLKTKINENHSLLIIEGDPIVEIKQVIEKLDSLIKDKIKNCFLCLEHNGILLKIQDENKINIPNINNKVGIFKSHTFKEVLIHNKIDFEKLKTKINEDHSLLITEGDPIVEVKKVIEQLDTLIKEKIKSYSIDRESNGISLIIKLEDKINISHPNKKIGIFNFKAVEEAFIRPMSSIKIIHIDSNDNVILEQQEEEKIRE